MKISQEKYYNDCFNELLHLIILDNQEKVLEVIRTTQIPKTVIEKVLITCFMYFNLVEPSLKCLEYILYKYKRYNYSIKFIQRLLNWAVHQNSVDLACLMLNHGANVEYKKSKAIKIAYMNSLRNEKEEVFYLLIRYRGIK